MRIKKLLFALVLLLFFGITFLKHRDIGELPLVAIANYGPHSSLAASVEGIKAELTRRGFIENKTIAYEISDVGFNLALIPQMVTKLRSKNPRVMIVISTPIAQFAKYAIKDLPLVFNAITDPLEAGLLKERDKSDGNMTGASDGQNLKVLLNFAKQIIPNATRVGVLYATGEANDSALIKMLKQAARATNMQVFAVPVDEPRDVPIRMQVFHNKVDFIYVGTSGAIQPTLPAIITEAKKMMIPIFNVDSTAVEKHQVLASFGVDYSRVGANAGQIVARLLNGENISSIQPQYPTINDHQGFISKQKLDDLKLSLPSNLTNIRVVE